MVLKQKNSYVSQNIQETRGQKWPKVAKKWPKNKLRSFFHCDGFRVLSVLFLP